ncbi:site-2 protease family protein [Roseobacter sp. YSTF-M11]|uniref:Zinc metalloprotease n=1 Tax=Roseobacter insulae TaxID=2859783 RepID=A0A9X1JYJ5_9RHOB|nr:site-2 protease family protein [Roseobacter insulae]MBW4706289.1 site-2 protease family protein [Roseobacter insulae]
MFSNSVKIFTLVGLDIRLDPSWALIAALITWSLSQQYFPSALPGQTFETYLTMAITAMLLFFASLLLHEVSHSVVARWLGVPIKGITLFLFGGVAELEAEPQSAAVEFWVALAGPAMSLCLALGFWVLTGISDIALQSLILTEVLSYLATINLILALFNLVPAFPLDGGRVLRAYLWHRTGDVLKATETASRSGRFFAYALMTMGLFALFQGALIVGLWQVMIGGFVFMAANSAYQTQLARSVFGDKTVGSLMKRRPVVVSPEMTLSEFVNQIMLHQRVAFVPVVEDGVLLGHMDQAVLAGIDRENWASTRVGDVFAGLDPETTIAPDLPVQELMAKIAKSGQRKYLVVKGRQLVGVVTLADLTKYLHLSELLHQH